MVAVRQGGKAHTLEVLLQKDIAKRDKLICNIRTL